MSASSRTLAVNVDVDALHFYRAIHGLPPEPGPDPCWAVGVPAFLHLFAELKLRATFFVVASDLVAAGESPEELARVEARRGLVRRMVEQGHEVASHSFSHDYALSLLSRQEAAADLGRARAILRELSGQAVEGFRAPGYNLSPALISAVADAGHRWSSSRFPSPPYFFAKWAVMALSRLRGRRSASIRGEVFAPFGALRPHRHQNGLEELPMSVLPFTRLPAIGTFFTFYGAGLAARLATRLDRRPWVNLEFHAIDLVDAADPGVGAELPAFQPDLRTPAAERRVIFQTWFEVLRRDRRQAPLGELIEPLALDKAHSV